VSGLIATLHSALLAGLLISTSSCFYMLFIVWNELYKFFRRYGLKDNFTTEVSRIWAG
jgi:hypothetical protein